MGRWPSITTITSPLPCYREPGRASGRRPDRRAGDQQAATGTGPANRCFSCWICRMMLSETELLETRMGGG